MYQELRVFSGNAHPELAQAICDYLEMPLGQSEAFSFSNENIFVRFCENIRARDVFLVQPIVSPVNDRLMELFVMIDAADPITNQDVKVASMADQAGKGIVVLLNKTDLDRDHTI